MKEIMEYFNEIIYNVTEISEGEYELYRRASEYPIIVSDMRFYEEFDENRKNNIYKVINPNLFNIEDTSYITNIKIDNLNELYFVYDEINDYYDICGNNESYINNIFSYDEKVIDEINKQFDDFYYNVENVIVKKRIKRLFENKDPKSHKEVILKKIKV